MTDHSFPSHVHFIGIGGIGMSALAQYFRHAGATVTGSDRDPSPAVREMLEEKGIAVRLGQHAEQVPEDAALVVYSDAVPEDNPERAAARARGLRELSYFEALGEVSKNAFTIAVAGTHGKTTTTGMLAKILRDAGKEPTAIVGSIVQDFKSNFVAGRPDFFVVEACEYRDHLLKLHPNILVLTNVEWDHGDWFPNLRAVQHTFRSAMERVPEEGVVVTSPHDASIAPMLEGLKSRIVDYSTESVPTLTLIGEFNEMNARAAKAAARAYDAAIPEESMNAALRSFQGTWRRFEYKGTTAAGAVVYDDYAHHPTAVRKTIAAAREKFPDHHITVVFHPHLYTRTRDLMHEFADAFNAADNVIIAPIYAAREQPIPGVTNDTLAARINAAGGRAAAMHSFEEIEHALRVKDAMDVIITMGAGDIYKVADRLTAQ